MKQMILNVKTNRQGSTSQVDLGIDEETWNEMTEEEQQEEINMSMWNVLDVWVEAE